MYIDSMVLCVIIKKYMVIVIKLELALGFLLKIAKQIELNI